MSWPIWFAIVNAFAMIAGAISVVFFHDRKSSDIGQLIDYSFSTHVLKRVILYYRGFVLLMLLFFITFSISLFALQKSAGVTLFAEGKASLLGMILFSFDLMARGAFFDWMEHFDWRLTPLHMNRGQLWFVIYAFVFRMFFAVTLLRILFSFAWLYRKIKQAKKEHSDQEAFI